MGVDTVGIISTENKDTSEIVNHIVTRLNDIEAYVNAIVMSTHNPWHIVINFEYNNEKRLLYLNMKCDTDHEDVAEGKKIIMSLGCWGSSEYIITHLCYALSHLGKTFVCPNDSKDIWI